MIERVLTLVEILRQDWYNLKELHLKICNSGHDACLRTIKRDIDRISSVLCVQEKGKQYKIIKGGEL